MARKEAVKIKRTEVMKITPKRPKSKVAARKAAPTGYHYLESGLDNVWLVNGYRVIDTPYGASVAIEDLSGLHRVLAESLVRGENRLSGDEFRFLRKELDMSQAKLGHILGAEEQTISLWERGRKKPVPSQSDKAIRLLYAAKRLLKPKQYVEFLAQLDEAPDHEHTIVVATGDSGWLMQKAA